MNDDLAAIRKSVAAIEALLRDLLRGRARPRTACYVVGEDTTGRSVRVERQP